MYIPIQILYEREYVGSHIIHKKSKEDLTC